MLSSVSLYIALLVPVLGNSPQNPACNYFTLQENLPEETVQIITYGAPEFSAILSMGLLGDGKTYPTVGSKVTTHYTLFLANCTMIESSRDSQPFTFTYGVGQVISGWDVAVGKMSLGQRAVVTLSPDMAYGEEGTGDGVIPPNAVLVFDIEILAIKSM